jgi:hypothetical protein
VHGQSNRRRVRGLRRPAGDRLEEASGTLVHGLFTACSRPVPGLSSAGDRWS